jgi:hypothetical protein
MPIRFHDKLFVMINTIDLFPEILERDSRNFDKPEHYYGIMRLFISKALQKVVKIGGDLFRTDPICMSSQAFKSFVKDNLRKYCAHKYSSSDISHGEVFTNDMA